MTTETLVVVGWPGARKYYRDIMSDEAIECFGLETEDGFDARAQIRHYGLARIYRFERLHKYFEIGFADAARDAPKTAQLGWTTSEMTSYSRGHDAFFTGIETEVI